MSRFPIIALLAGTAMTLPSTVSAQESPTICYVTFSLAVGYFQDGVAGAQAAADELGATLVVLDPQADAARQVSQVEDCVARQSDAIIVDAIESGSLGGALDQAEAAGIPVAALDTPIDHPAIDTLIGIPQFESSREFGQFVAGYVIGAMEGEADIGIMLASTEIQLARRDGFLEALRSVPGAEVVAEGDGRNILEQATAAAENMLTANPSINVIYATGEPQMQGALAAAQSQGRDIRFFTWDEIPGDATGLLEDGTIVGHLRQNPAMGGEMGVRLLMDKLAGEEITTRYTYTPTVITAYNMDGQ